MHITSSQEFESIGESSNFIQQLSPGHPNSERIENAINLVSGLLRALNLANTDQIDLSLSMWRKMDPIGKNYIPDAINALFETLNSQPESVKYSYALRQRQIVITYLGDMLQGVTTST